MENKNLWTTYNKRQLKELEALNADYMNFLTECKTERECVDYIVNEIEEQGYVELGKLIKENKTLQP